MTSLRKIFGKVLLDATGKVAVFCRLDSYDDLPVNAFVLDVECLGNAPRIPHQLDKGSGEGELGCPIGPVGISKPSIQGLMPIDIQKAALAYSSSKALSIASTASFQPASVVLQNSSNEPAEDDVTPLLLRYFFRTAISPLMCSMIE